jgi:phosphatidylglycerol lysyltransferase
LLPVLVAVALCVAGVVVLRRVLADHSFADLHAAVLAIPHAKLLAAVLLTVGSYFVLTGYDALALRVLGVKLDYPRTALASFVGYVYGHNVGLSVLGSGAARLRLYGWFGVTPPQVAWIVALCSVTFWLGLVALAGGALLLTPEIVAAELHLPTVAMRAVGVVLLAAVAGYVVLCARRREPIRVRQWSMPMPTPRTAVLQVAVSLVDWTVAASVLYSLLPLHESLPFARFFVVFLSAQLVGLVTGVPGGIGTFEGTVIRLLHGQVDETAALGALVAYRVVYYLAPFLLGTLLFLANEFVHRRETVVRVSGVVARAGTQVVPRLLAMATFVAGSVLLISGGTPPLPERLHWIRRIVELPAPVLEISHFSASVVGMALLLFARGLYQRLHAAWVASVGLLAAGALFSLLKAADWEEATVLAIVLAFLVPSRRHFTREAKLVAQPFTRGWIAAVVVVLASTFVLVRFAFKYTGDDFWWRVPFDTHAGGRALRATVGAAVVALTFALGRLLKPAQPRLALPDEAELARARDLVRASSDSTAHLALLGDKSFFWSESGKSFVMYAIQSRSWIALGDPIGDPSEASELLWRFHESVHRHGGRTVFYEVSGDRLPLYLDLGLILRKLGEEARVPVAGFALEGRARKNLRRGVGRVEEAGGRFELVEPKDVAPLLPELERVSAEWLATHGGVEKGFSLGFFDRDYVVAFGADRLVGRRAVRRPDAPRRRRARRSDGLPLRAPRAARARAGLPLVQPRHGAAVGTRGPSARAAVAQARRHALPPRQPPLPLPRAAPVQGEVRPRLAPALPRRAEQPLAAVRAARRHLARGADAEARRGEASTRCTRGVTRQHFDRARRSRRQRRAHS